MASVYEKLKSRYGQGAQSGGRASKFWRPSEGTHQLRFMTFMKDGEEELEVEETWHYKVIKGESRSSVICGGENCPICKLKGKVPDSVWSRIKPAKRYLVNAILREGNDDGSDRQIIANLPKTVIKAVAEMLNEEGFEDALNKDKGLDLRIKRTGEGLNTRYTVLPVPSYSSWGAEYEPEDLTLVAAKPKTLEELEAIAATYTDGNE